MSCITRGFYFWSKRQDPEGECDQEFRILDACTKFTQACEEIRVECQKGETVPEALLSDMLAEVMDYCQTLQIFSEKRRTNINSIVEMEKQNLEEFR